MSQLYTDTPIAFGRVRQLLATVGETDVLSTLESSGEYVLAWVGPHAVEYVGVVTPFGSDLLVRNETGASWSQGAE